ncbi:MULTISPECIES: ferrous iron transport protein B [Methanosphaera]|uniref:Ferrous iron transport protein B n=1 Tax=Methanosphaera stadtmanae TaxID=2317 RepID=A0A328Q4K6_9EURY|nr:MULTISPECIES: ferrous iron transport protein B [Methanosphaera]MEE0490339.1 ferrous iron transport protein B [Methanosphaera stadtmanae]RAP02506.1 ferrous iron transport protein B [Methanosphaera stadtmanae]RAP46226.1 MAG: ferrous iron transport protein B [Methanosphaera sp. DEW79]
MEKLKFLLAGNPNVGKSTIFNHLTGMKQHVGNWPGKTVEQKSGSFEFDNYDIEIIDLPGNYSLTPYSVEEQVSRDAIIHEENDAVINVIDAENIQRNLYLTLQIMETGANTILAVNLLNYAEDAGFKINLKKLEETLGIPIVVVDAREGTGLNELVRATIKAANHPKDCSSRLTYGFELDDHVNEVKGLFPNLKIGSAPDSWTAIKLLEGDDEVIDIAEKSSDKQNLQKVNNIRRHLEGILNDNVDDAFINARYAEIDSIMKICVKKPGAGKKTLTDKIDDIVTNRILGIPIFLIVIYGVFQLTYTIGGPFQDLIDEAFTMLIDSITPILGDGLASSFVLNGVIGGVGSILTFIPIIFILFFLLSLIEDVGYLARAAFVIDRAMYKIMGLSGKAFIPMILGFGCDVTGIMATRTLANESDRISTMLALPFISCSARIPIYALFTAVFFVSNQAEITFGLYILGMIVAIIVARLLKRTAFSEESAPFIMELPPYRLPTLKSAGLHMWERGSLFIKKAGTIILGTSIIVWLLGNLPPGVEEGSVQSIIGMFGNIIAPIFAPLGFGFWQAAVALVFGIMAKEIVVSTFGTLFGVGEDGISAVLPSLFTPLSSLSFMVFTLLYVPCFACLGAIKEESNSWKWMGVCVVTCCVIAYIMAFIVYQGGLLLGFT